jgi:hypothetical protein
MAYIHAYKQIDINKIDFSFPFAHTTGKMFFDDTNRNLYGTVYKDLYYITGIQGPRV